MTHAPATLRSGSDSLAVAAATEHAAGDNQQSVTVWRDGNDKLEARRAAILFNRSAGEAWGELSWSLVEPGKFLRAVSQFGSYSIELEPDGILRLTFTAVADTRSRSCPTKFQVINRVPVTALEPIGSRPLYEYYFDLDRRRLYGDRDDKTPEISRVTYRPTGPGSDPIKWEFTGKSFRRDRRPFGATLPQSRLGPEGGGPLPRA